MSSCLLESLTFVETLRKLAVLAEDGRSRLGRNVMQKMPLSLQDATWHEAACYSSVSGPGNA